MGAAAELTSAFVDKARGVLLETHRLNSGAWDSAQAARHQDDLQNLADYAGNLDLEQVQSTVLDLYAYVSVFAEGTLKPNAAQCADLERMIQDAQAQLLPLAPTLAPTPGSAAVVYLLAPSLELAPGLRAAMRQEGLQLTVFDDGDAFADALRAQLPQAILIESAFVGATTELLDDLAVSMPEATRLPLIGVDNGEPSARLQALVGGADLFLPRLDDPATPAQIKELIRGQSSEPFRVLVVDDDRQMCTYCESILTRAGMRVESTMDATQVSALVRDFKPDLVLMDLYLPGMDGLTLTAELRRQADAVVLPIVFLSGEQSEEARFQAIQVGGDDFLTKPIRPRHLVTAVRSRIKRVRTLGKQLTRRRGDATGYMRRGAFLDHLGDHKARASDAAITSLLLVVSLDQAAELQERLSLSVGHELEQAVAMRLATSFAESDRYCLIQEFGFGVSIDRERRDVVLAFAESLRDAVASQPFKVDGQDMRLTVSVGLALMPGRERSLDDWISAAFAAARTAFRLGGNRVEGILGESDSPLPPERLLRVRELLHVALDKRGLSIEFQPLIPLRGTEAGRYAMIVNLADRREPLGGISRLEFVPVARELGLQKAIDRVLISQALRALDDQRSLNRVRDLLLPLDFASVDEDQLAWMQSEFRQRAQLDQRLTLEFDASALIASATARRVLDRLRADGIRLGAVERSARLGHLGELVLLPLKVLRLPSAVLQAMDSEASGPALENWQRSGRELVVEDVRDLGSITRLWNLGIDYLQGDSLATASPRLDFDFSEISLS
ncbi:MAG TPA: response regulator [Xanthomonadales bacterium]|nr:response regulator [Xanthomonadales bacterium]